MIDKELVIVKAYLKDRIKAWDDIGRLATDRSNATSNTSACDEAWLAVKTWANNKSNAYNSALGYL